MNTQKTDKLIFKINADKKAKAIHVSIFRQKSKVAEKEFKDFWYYDSHNIRESFIDFVTDVSPEVYREFGSYGRLASASSDIPELLVNSFNKAARDVFLLEGTRLSDCVGRFCRIKALRSYHSQKMAALARQKDEVLSVPDSDSPYIHFMLTWALPLLDTKRRLVKLVGTKRTLALAKQPDYKLELITRVIARESKRYKVANFIDMMDIAPKVLDHVVKSPYLGSFPDVVEIADALCKKKRCVSKPKEIANMFKYLFAIRRNDGTSKDYNTARQ